MPPKISVIIPAFNAEPFIADAINSVLAQEDSQEMEIIVIDDGSSDNTRTVVSDMAKHYRQITLLSNNRTKGPSGARNTGLLYATGNYMTFLDSDDLWLQNHIKEGVTFLDKNKNIDVVFYNFEIHEYETKRKISDWFSERSFSKVIKSEEIEDEYYLIRDDMFNSLLDESFMHLQSMIIRRKVIEETLFNEKIKRSEDRDFSIKLYLNSKAMFAFKNLVTGIYYRHGNSLTSTSVENSLLTTLDHINLFSEYLTYIWLDNVTAKKLKHMLFNRHLSASYCYRKLNRHGLALTHLFQSYWYGITASQIKEFAKIFASLAIYNMLQLTKRST